MPKIKEGTIFTSNIFENAISPIDPMICDLVFKYDGHDIFLLKDNKIFNHVPKDVLQVFVEIAIPMSNRFSNFVNKKFQDDANPYILSNGVFVEWFISKRLSGKEIEFVCLFDFGVQNIKACFLVEIPLFEEEDDYLTYRLFLNCLEAREKKKITFTNNELSELKNLRNKMKKIKKEAKLVGNKLRLKKSVISELILLKKQISIVMPKALQNSNDNGLQSNLLDLRNQVFRLLNNNSSCLSLKEIESNSNSFSSFLVKTNVFNMRFLEKESYKNMFDYW